MSWCPRPPPGDATRDAPDVHCGMRVSPEAFGRSARCTFWSRTSLYFPFFFFFTSKYEYLKLRTRVVAGKLNMRPYLYCDAPYMGRWDTWSLRVMDDA